MTTEKDTVQNWLKILLDAIARWIARKRSKCDHYAMRKSIGWFRLKRTGESRLVATSYGWIVIVPILAKLFDKVSGEHTVELGVIKESILINLELPFNWKVFFFMALSFSIGKALYGIWCPLLLRHFEDYREFRERHAGTWVLAVWLDEARNKDDLLTPERRNTLRQTISGIMPHESGRSQLIKDQLNDASESIRSDVFDELRRHLGCSHPFALLASHACFRFGFVLFLAVMAQNVWFVIQSIIS